MDEGEMPGSGSLLAARVEAALATAWRVEGDIEAGRGLFAAHEHLALQVARSYRGYGLDHAELIRQARLGLAAAVEHFDPASGARLARFALPWIEARVQSALLRAWPSLPDRSPRAHRRLYLAMVRTQEDLVRLGDGEGAAFEDEGASRLLN
jgi:DNA-directed RNA polymerase sigma subunit (sigma70/sigma32)